MKRTLILLLLPLCFFSCKKKSKVEFKISEDICFACINKSYFVLGDDTIQIRSIVTPNMDNFNDFFKIRNIDTIPSLFINNLTIYDRDGNEIIHFNDYNNDWPTYIPSQWHQNIEGLSNGLFQYTLIKGPEQIHGYFIIIISSDSYLDKTFWELPCRNDCMYLDPGDPYFNT